VDEDGTKKSFSLNPQDEAAASGQQHATHEEVLHNVGMSGQRLEALVKAIITKENLADYLALQPSVQFVCPNTENAQENDESMLNRVNSKLLIFMGHIILCGYFVFSTSE